MAPGAPLRVAFLGSPPFAVPALDALHAAGHAVAAVYTQPPRPAGRGQRLVTSAVHARADALGLPVRHPARLRGDEAEWARFAALGLDVAVVAAYGLILPGAMLRAPRLGCLNIHASLLPRWRGASPIQAALRAGDPETGVTIMRMDEGLDTGPTLARAALPLGAHDTAPSVSERLSVLGAALLLATLAAPPPAMPQPEAGVTHAPKLARSDGLIDWTRDAAAIDRQIRALLPWPGTATRLPAAEGGRGDQAPLLKVLAATPLGRPAGTAGAAPGTVLDDAFTVACGTGALRLARVQMAGRPAGDGAAFLRGHAIRPGAVLPSTDAPS